METFLGLHITCTTPRKHSRVSLCGDWGGQTFPPPILTSHHILQRNNCKHPNNMVWKFRPQGPAMPCKNSWENYWKLMLSHIRHLPQTVYEQDAEHHIRPQPSLPRKKKKKRLTWVRGPTQRDFATFFSTKAPQWRRKNCCTENNW